jgi:hypothetical protein
MKSTKEIMDSLHERRDNYLAEKSKSRKKNFKGVLLGMSFAVAFLVGFFIWKGNDPVESESKPLIKETDTFVITDETKGTDIVNGGGNHSNSGSSELIWNEKKVSLKLMELLKKTDDDSLMIFGSMINNSQSSDYDSLDLGIQYTKVQTKEGNTGIIIKLSKSEFAQLSFDGMGDWFFDVAENN